MLIQLFSFQFWTSSSVPLIVEDLPRLHLPTAKDSKGNATRFNHIFQLPSISMFSGPISGSANWQALLSSFLGAMGKFGIIVLSLTIALTLYMSPRPVHVLSDLYGKDSMGTCCTFILMLIGITLFALACSVLTQALQVTVVKPVHSGWYVANFYKTKCRYQRGQLPLFLSTSL